MKRCIAALAVSILTITPVLAQEKHDHATQPEKEGMQAHMKKMREQMAQMRAATDPKERERMMGEHMKAMEDAMANMQGMGCAKM